MVEKLFAQLESLTKDGQIQHLKKIYPDLTGVSFGDGFLWQHPGNSRQTILKEFKERLRRVIG